MSSPNGRLERLFGHVEPKRLVESMSSPKSRFATAMHDPVRGATWDEPRIALLKHRLDPLEAELLRQERLVLLAKQQTSEGLEVTLRPWRLPPPQLHVLEEDLQPFGKPANHALQEPTIHLVISSAARRVRI